MNDYIGEELGNYRLIRLLGSGGFAEVYLGEHRYLKTQAAIKVLRVSFDDQALAQFLTEARTIAHLEHPNIVRTLEFGVQGSTAYLVMSYASNGTVLRHYPRGAAVPLHRVIEYARQIADALQYAHARELIHRDVKPENMLLGRDGEIFLSDFGLAVLSPNSSSRRPIDKAGTINYMAPEQIAGKPSKSSDQYALGVVVYEWLCGHLPFTGLDKEIALQHLHASPPPLREQAPSVPSAIEQVVMKALAKDPSQRFLSVLHFAQTLEEAYQPHKLVRLLPSDSPGRNAAAQDTPFKHETYSRAKTEPENGSRSQSVLDADTMTRSPQKVLTGQAASASSALNSRRLSRRVVLAGLAGLTAVNVASAGAIWSFHNLGFSASSPRGSSNRMQVSAASQATPTPTHSPLSGSSTPPPTPGNPHTTPTQHRGSTAGTTSAPRTMPTPQATPTANTSSTSAYTSASDPSSASVSISTTNTSTSASVYASTGNTSSTAAYPPTATPTPAPILQLQPTPPGMDQQGTQGQQNSQGNNGRGQNNQGPGGQGQHDQ